jgi:hypothetical protein
MGRNNSIIPGKTIEQEMLFPMNKFSSMYIHINRYWRSPKIECLTAKMRHAVTELAKRYMIL